MELIDIGANLGHDSFDHDRDAVLQRAREAGVAQLVVTGASREGSPKALALADQSLRQGRALDARRFADAARTIADLDELLPWTNDDHDPDAAAARGDIMRDFIQDTAVDLAMKLHRGEPLEPHHLVMVDRFHARVAEEKAAK